MNTLHKIVLIGVTVVFGIALIIGYISSAQWQIASIANRINIRVNNSELTIEVPSQLTIYFAQLTGTTLKLREGKLVKTPISIDLLPHFTNNTVRVPLPEGNYTLSLQVGRYVPLLGKVTYDEMIGFEVNPPPSIKLLEVDFTPPNEISATLSITDPLAVNQSSIRVLLEDTRAKLDVVPVKVDSRGNGVYLARTALSPEQLMRATELATRDIPLKLVVKASDVTRKRSEVQIPIPDPFAIIASDLGVNRTKAIQMAMQLSGIGMAIRGNVTLSDIYTVMKVSPELLQAVYKVIEEDEEAIEDPIEGVGIILGRAVLAMKKATELLRRIPLKYPHLAAAIIGNATLFGEDNGTAMARAAMLAQQIQEQYGWLGIDLLRMQPEVLVAMVHLLNYIPEPADYPLELYSLSKAIGEWVYWDGDVVPSTKRRGCRLTGMILPIVPTSYHKAGKYPGERAWIADPSMLPAFYKALRKLIVGWYLKRVQNGTFESLEEMLSSGCLRKALARGLPKEIVLGAIVEFGDACVFYFTSIDYTGRESTASLLGGYSPWQLRNMSKMIAWLKANTQQLDRIYKQLEEVRKKVTPEMIVKSITQRSYISQLPRPVQELIWGIVYGDGAAGFTPCMKVWKKFLIDHADFVCKYAFFRGAPTFLRLVAEPRVSCDGQEKTDMFIAIGWLLYNTPSSQLNVDYPQPDMRGLGHDFFVFIDGEGRLISPVTIDIDRFPSCYYKYGWPPERISIGLFNTAIYGADEILKALRPGEP